MEVLAPDIEGEFEILITMVQEEVVWFDAVDASNACSSKVRIVRDSTGSLPEGVDLLMEKVELR
jgi:hypothetical protein